MNQIATAIFDKLTDLEQQVQKLKVQAYFSLPRKKQVNSTHNQASINKALKATRNKIWNKKYAKKIKGIS